MHWGYWDDPSARRIVDDEYGIAAERLTWELLALAEVRDGQSLLDAGCGFGGTIAALNERHDGLALTGLNIDPAQLARARGLVHARGGNRIEFVEGDACRLPFADASFDRVTAVECVFHFPSRQAFFREAFRVLKPGGVLACSDFLPAPWAVPLVGRPWGVLRRHNIIGAFNFEYPLARYRALAAATGFTVSAERDITANTLPTYRYLAGMFGAGRGAMHAVAAQGARALGAISAAGVLRYWLLSFRKG